MELWRRRENLLATGIQLESCHAKASLSLERLKDDLIREARKRKEPPSGPLRTLAAAVQDWHLFRKRAKNYETKNRAPFVQPTVCRIWSTHAPHHYPVKEEELKHHVRCLMEAPRYFEKVSENFRQAWLAARREAGCHRFMESQLADVDPLLMELEAAMLKEALALLGGPGEYAAIRSAKKGSVQDRKAWQQMESHLGEIGCFEKTGTLAALEFFDDEGSLVKPGYISPRVPMPGRRKSEVSLHP